MIDLFFVKAIDKLVATWHTLSQEEKINVAKVLANHGLKEVRQIMISIYKQEIG